MPCETCNRTMQRVNVGDPDVYWCPTCGTIRSSGMVPEFAVPKLVGDAKQVCGAFPHPLQMNRIMPSLRERCGYGRTVPNDPS